MWKYNCLKFEKLSRAGNCIVIKWTFLIELLFMKAWRQNSLLITSTSITYLNWNLNKDHSPIRLFCLCATMRSTSSYDHDCIFCHARINQLINRKLCTLIWCIKENNIACGLRLPFAKKTNVWLTEDVDSIYLWYVSFPIFKVFRFGIWG